MSSSSITPDSPADLSADATPGPRARQVMHRVESYYEKAHTSWRAAREWRSIARASLDQHERLYNARLADTQEALSRAYQHAAEALLEATLLLDKESPPIVKPLGGSDFLSETEMVYSVHLAVDINIDRHTDIVLARDWLPVFKTNGVANTVEELRKACAEMRAKGFEVFPPCSHYSTRGTCLGHLILSKDRP